MVDWRDCICYPFKKTWGLIKWWWDLSWKWKLSSALLLASAIAGSFWYATDFNLVLMGKHWLGISEQGNYISKTDSTKEGLVKTIDENKGKFKLSDAYIEAEARYSSRGNADSDRKPKKGSPKYSDSDSDSNSDSDSSYDSD